MRIVQRFKIVSFLMNEEGIKKQYAIETAIDSFKGLIKEGLYKYHHTDFKTWYRGLDETTKQLLKQ